MAKDYHKILGVTYSASQEDIKTAYKRLAKQWHPDKWINSSDADRLHAEEMMKDLNEAYEILKQSSSSSAVSSNIKAYSWNSEEESPSQPKSKYAKEENIWDIDLNTLANPYKSNKTKTKTDSNKSKDSLWFDSSEITKDFFGI